VKEFSVRIIRSLAAVLPFFILSSLGNAANRSDSKKSASPSIATVSQLAELTPSDGQAGDNFGFSLAMDGSVLVASAPAGLVLGEGAAYVFVNSGTAWTQAGKLTASDGAQFGFSLAIVGNTIAVGNDRGAVYVFVEPLSGWTDMTETAKLLSSTYGGSFVAISPDQTIIISGNPGVSCEEGNAGVFYLPAGGWADVTQPDGTLHSNGNWSAAIGDGFVALGNSPCSSDLPGTVALFHTPKCRCLMHSFQTLTSSDYIGGDEFGLSTSISGNTLLVGAPGIAAAYLFDPNGIGQVQQLAKLTRSGAPLSSAFGARVSLSGNVAVLGAFEATVAHNQAQGAAYAYLEPAGGWMNSSTPSASLKPADGAAGDQFGIAVSLSGSQGAIGAPGHAVDGNAGQGAVYLFGR
jgi:hypothetical protein